MAQSATAGVKPMNQYETIMWEKEMKEQILCEAHALFVGSYPHGSVFDIIHTTTYTEGSSQEPSYASYLVVYTAPGTARKRELVWAFHDCKNVAEGLNYLLNLLRLKMGDQIRREEEDKKKQDLAKLDQDLKDFREQWVPGR